MSKTVIRKLIIILLITFATMSLAACGTIGAEPTPESSTAADQDVTVGLLLSSLNNPLYVSLQNGAIEAASRLQVSLLVREASDSHDRQSAQVQELLDLDIDVLIINPVDSTDIVADVEKARAANVPVLTVERQINSDVIVTHISSDDVLGGQMAAAFLVERLQEQGVVAELVGSGGTSIARDRGSGFNRLLSAYPDVRVVARRVAHFDRREANRVFTEIINTHDNIDAVFAHNDEMILGAIEAAQEAGREDELIFVGFDAVSGAVDAIESGKLAATIAQQPTEMGRLSIETAVGYVRGEQVPKFIPVDLALITR